MAEWILLLSQKLLKVSNACTHTCAKTSIPLVIYCVVNDALVWSTAAAKHAVNAAITFYDFNCLNLIINQRNFKACKFKVCSWLYLPIAMET